MLAQGSMLPERAFVMNFALSAGCRSAVWRASVPGRQARSLSDAFLSPACRTYRREKKGQLNVAMESAFLTPAPSHATVDIRAAAAACGQATAASAVA